MNTLGPRQNGRHFADDIFKCIFVNENVWIPIKISLKVVPRFPINNILVLVQIMAWRRAGEKPLSEPMMVTLPSHICVTRPQWFKGQWPESLRNVSVEIRILWQELSSFWLDHSTATIQSEAMWENCEYLNMDLLSNPGHICWLVDNCLLFQFFFLCDTHV